MSSIDNRIVSMKFDNAQFEKGVSTTISSMGKLKESLNFKEASASLQGLQAAGGRFSMGHMEGAITGVSKSFTAMAAVGITAISNLTNKVVDAGINMGKSLTLGPISAGLHEYETNLGSIQTILANTKKEGSTLQDVNSALDTLNEYSDQTIYNFSEMARNIGTFTAAGVKLDPAVNAIKGISNLAAISGSNAEQASTAMYQLSQALAAGKVGLQDWNSVVNAGMGGAVFQDALKRTARAHGIAVDDIIKKQGSFRESLKKGWITSKVLTETLSQFTGDLSDEELKAQGYTADQIKQIQDLAKTAKTAATQVKTGSQLMDTLRETAGSGWAKTWQLILGDFGEAPKLFTALNNSIGGWISANADARNKILEDWKKNKGREALLAGFKNIFVALNKIIKPIKEAFRDIFPPMTGKRLADMTKSFEKFTEKLKISDEAAAKIKSTFKGVFAVFSIIKTIVVDVVKGIFGIFGALSSAGGDAGGGLLSLTAGLGEFIAKIDEMLKKADPLGKAFKAIAGWVKIAADGVHRFVSAITGKISGKAGAGIDGLSESFSHFGDIISNIVTAIQQGNLGETLLKGLGLGILVIAFRNFNKFLSNIGTNLTDFFGMFKSIGGAFDNLGDVFGGMTGSLKAMQQDLKADALMKIAIALLVLVAALWILSTIDAGDIVGGLAAMAIMLAMLNSALKAFSKTTSAMGSAKFTLIAAGLLILAVALTIMAGAVALFGHMKPATLEKGLLAIGLVMAGVVAVTAALGKAGGGTQLIITAVGLTVLAGALAAMSKALKIYAKIDIKTLASSLGKVAAVLIVIGTAMRLMPKNMIFTGAGLVIVAFALSILADSLDQISKIPMKQLGKAIGVLAASLLIIGIALYAMSGTIAGSLALAIAAGSLALLVPVLKAFGQMSLGEIGKSLLMLAGVFLVLGVAGLVLTPVVPLIVLLGIAIALLGAGMLAAGAGMLLFATALGILASVGGVAVAILIASVKGLLALIPYAAEQIALGMIRWVEVIGENAPKIVEAIGKLLSALLDEIVKRAPEFYRKAGDLIIELLDAITDKLPDIVESATTLIETFVDTFGSRENIRRLTTAAAELVTNFLNGLADTIRDKDDEFIDAGKNIGSAIVEGVGKGLLNFTPLGFGITHLVDWIKGRTKDELNSGSPAKVFIPIGGTIPEGMAVGIRKYTYMATSATEDMGEETVSTMKDTFAKISDAVDMNVDMTPVIAPVLDLTDFRKKASDLESIIQTTPLQAAVSADQATAIASIKKPIEDTSSTNQEQQPIKFEQNNYSPKALSPSEIYRNTRNQLIFAKELMAG